MSRLKDPSLKYASFVEKGYRITAFWPESDEERTEFRVEVVRDADEQALFSYAFRMNQEPLFGIGSDDKATLEDVTDTVLSLLPDAAQYSVAALALCQSNADLNRNGVVFTAA